MGPPGLVWTGAENLAPTGIRSPDRPARSESLYRLSYPGRQLIMRTDEIVRNKKQFACRLDSRAVVVNDVICCSAGMAGRNLWLAESRWPWILIRNLHEDASLTC